MATKSKVVAKTAPKATVNSSAIDPAIAAATAAKAQADAAAAAKAQADAAAKAKADADAAAATAKTDADAAATKAAQQAAIDAANAAAQQTSRLAAAQEAANAAANTQAELANSDAFDTLKTTFASYGLSSLADTVTQLMTIGKTPQEALTTLKYDTSINPATGKAWNTAYTTRFAGNQARINNGLNALSESQYIATEDAYAQTLDAYGLGTMLSVDRTANEAKFASYIGNDVSSTEFNDRIKTATDSVINADPVTMQTFKQYYGGLTTSDIVSYFLAPNETLPILQNKVAAAQVGTAATEQGLTVGADRAGQLAQQLGGYGSLGNIAGAYQNVASVLPGGQKLSDIYKAAGINYDQTTAENEFIGQNADAAQKRKQLASLERASFSGDSGVNPTAGNLASARTVQGKF